MCTSIASHRSQHFYLQRFDLYATSPASTAFLHKKMTSVEGAVDAQEAGGVANVGQSILIYGLLK